MAAVVLSDTHGRLDFFQQSILSNLQYWSGWLEDKLADNTALDQERNNIVKAITFALELEKTWTSAYNLLIAFSPYMEKRGHWEAWAWVLQRAMNVAGRVGDQENEANLSALLGLMLQRQSRFKEAIAQHRRTIRIARQAGNHFALARAGTNLGAIYTRQGYWYRAEVWCCYVLNLFEQVNSDYGRAHTENHLGLLYMRQRRWELAQQHLERAGAIWQAMGDERGSMKGFINLSALHIEMKQPARALRYLEKARRQAELSGDETEVGIIYENMGLAHRLSGDFTKAESDYRQAEAIFREFSNSTELARVWGNLGMMYLHQRKWKETVFYLEKSLEAWRSLGSKTGEIETLLSCIEYELTGNKREQVAERIKEVENLIGQNNKDSPYQRYHVQLDKCRRSLAEHSTRQTTTA